VATQVAEVTASAQTAANLPPSPPSIPAKRTLPSDMKVQSSSTAPLKVKGKGRAAGYTQSSSRQPNIPACPPTTFSPPVTPSVLARPTRVNLPVLPEFITDLLKRQNSPAVVYWELHRCLLGKGEYKPDNWALKLSECGLSDMDIQVILPIMLSELKDR